MRKFIGLILAVISILAPLAAIAFSAIAPANPWAAPLVMAAIIFASLPLVAGVSLLLPASEEETEVLSLGQRFDLLFGQAPIASYGLLLTTLPLVAGLFFFEAIGLVMIPMALVGVMVATIAIVDMRSDAFRQAGWVRKNRERRIEEEEKKWGSYDPLDVLIKDAVEASMEERQGVELDWLAARIDLAYDYWLTTTGAESPEVEVAQEEYHYYK